MIDTKALRSRILDLAIQGKLTEQLESDGTAEILFNTNDTSIKENIPYDIPNNWKWVKLSNIGTTNIGLTYHPSDVVNNGTIVIRSSNIVNGKMDYSDIVKVNCSIKDNQYVNKNDIVICARNGSKALVGKNAIYDGESGKVAFGAFMAIFRTEYYAYVHLFFNTQTFRRYFSSDDSKQINQVTQAILKNSIIPLPPLAEQKRIVERVEEIFRLLDTIDKAQEKYSADVESLKGKLFTVAIQGKLTKQLESDGTASELYNDIQAEKEVLSKKGELYREKSIKPVKQADIPYDIPKSWIWVRLGELAQVVTKGSSPKWQGVNYTDSKNGILFVTSENVGNGCLLLDKRKYIEKPFNEMHPSSILKKGDILTNIVGASIGRTAIFDEDIEDANINQAVCVVRLINLDMSDYILRYLCSKDAIRLMLGKVVDTARANLSLTAVANLMVPLPPLAEQKRIADVLERVLGVVE